MYFAITVLAFVVALGVLIVFHEFGHYLIARLFGVKVLRFSIGFGRPLWRIRSGRDRTEWVIAALPLGGYVKMLDEHEAPVAPEEAHRAFNRQRVWRRIAIVAAGPAANFLLAIVFYWALFVGGVQEAKPVVGTPDPGTGVQASVAGVGGLRPGDHVVAIDGGEIRVWEDLVKAVRARPSEFLNLGIVRGSEKIDIRLKPQAVQENGARFGRIGALPRRDPQA